MSFDTLSPWDSAPYFQNPVTVSVTGGSPSPVTQSVLGADPMRVAIIFSSNPGGGNIVFGPSNTLTNNGGGLVLTANVPVQTILWADYGRLCQVEWFANLTSTQTITIVTVSLVKWPRRKLRYDKATITDAIERISRGN